MRAETRHVGGGEPQLGAGAVGGGCV